MALSETGKWLQSALQRNSEIELDSETLYSLVSYCEMASPADAREYLLNIVGNVNSKDIVAEYMRRRGGTNTVPDDGMQAYHKPREETWSSPVVKKGPKQKTGSIDAAGSGSVHQKDLEEHKSPLYSGNGVLSAENIVQKGKRPVGKGKKGGKGISLADASKGKVVFARGEPCTCQCTRHKLINNCLSCGRIVCEQEGEGPCKFCGALVLKEGSDYGGLGGMQLPPASQSQAAAEEFKNRLVEYDRTAASRTTVIDDQGDYFQIDGNTWLSEKEKQLLQQRQDEEERIAAERRKRVVVSIDLLGRKVVMADQDNGNANGETMSILGGEMFVSEALPKVSRVKPNPNLTEAPIFVDKNQPAKPRGGGKPTARQPSSTKDTRPLTSGRVQHDDPVVEALIGRQLNDIGINEEEKASLWQGPKAKLSDHVEQREAFNECQAGKANVAESSSASTSGRGQSKEASGNFIREGLDQGLGFDICPRPASGKLKPVVLSPSVLMQKQLERKEALNEASSKQKQPNRVLLPGMVLLKRWLSPDEQIEIIKHCRMLGIGPGGFYQPQYDGENSKMHLRMMCLGMQWEPASRSYGVRRQHHDNALAPALPDLFIRLVEKALSAARLAATPNVGGKSTRIVMDKQSTLPDLTPNVCIVNFYERSGNLGLHQDKDESAESLQKECPVVSFSIGDSAEFVYGKERDVQKASMETLECGDVLIFGGPARMIYHGVTKVLPDTCPKWLSHKTNLRPGRLNLTFRQF